MTVKTIKSKILGNNRERIADDSKSNHATNTAETFFLIFLRGMFETVACAEDLPPKFQRKLNMLVTTNEERETRKIMTT